MGWLLERPAGTTRDLLRRAGILGLASVLVILTQVQGVVTAATDPSAPIAAKSPEATTNDVIIDRASPPPRPTAAGAQPPTGNPLWAVPLRSLSVSRERPLFSPSRRPPPAPVAAAPYVPPVTPPPPKAEPDHPLLALVGTIVSESEGIAIFLDQTSSEFVRLKTGQSHAGWILQTVNARDVGFEKDQQRAILALPVPGEDPSATAPLIGKTWQAGNGQRISPPTVVSPRANPQPSVNGQSPQPSASAQSQVDGWGWRQKN